MKRALRRGILSVDPKPYGPGAYGTSQSQLIVQSRVKRPSERGSAWRVASSIPRTLRVEAEGRRLFVLVLFQSSCLPNLPLGTNNSSTLPTPSSVDRVSQNEDAGVAKVIPSPVLFAPRRRRISTDGVDTSRSPSPPSSKTPRTCDGRHRRDTLRSNPHRIRPLPTRPRQRRARHPRREGALRIRMARKAQR